MNENEPLLHEHRNYRKIFEILSATTTLLAIAAVILSSLILHRVYEENPNLDFLGEPIDCIVAFTVSNYNESSDTLTDSVWIGNACGFSVNATLLLSQKKGETGQQIFINVDNLIEPRLLTYTFRPVYNFYSPTLSTIMQKRAKAVNEKSRNGKSCLTLQSVAGTTLGNNCISNVNVTYYDPYDTTTPVANLLQTVVVSTYSNWTVNSGFVIWTALLTLFVLLILNAVTSCARLNGGEHYTATNGRKYAFPPVNYNTVTDYLSLPDSNYFVKRTVESEVIGAINNAALLLDLSCRSSCLVQPKITCSMLSFPSTLS